MLSNHPGENEEKSGVDFHTSGRERRSLLKYLLATSIGASLVSILYPAIRYLIPPKQPESQSDQVTVTTVDQLPANSGRVFKFGSEPAILIRTPAGKFEAFSAVCTHLQCTVHYRPDRHDIYCPCHGGVYNLEGVPTGGPPPRPLTKYRAEVRDNEITVLRG